MWHVFLRLRVACGNFFIRRLGCRHCHNAHLATIILPKKKHMNHLQESRKQKVKELSLNGPSRKCKVSACGVPRTLRISATLRRTTCVAVGWCAVSLVKGVQGLSLKAQDRLRGRKRDAERGRERRLQEPLSAWFFCSSKPSLFFAAAGHKDPKVSVRSWQGITFGKKDV